MPRNDRRRPPPGRSSVPYRPGESRPRRNMPPGAGMGNPGEDAFFWEGYRDWGQGEERPLDVVFDPSCPPKDMLPALSQEQEALKCTLNNVFARQVVFTKQPANVQPPWWARPIIKAKNILVEAGETVPVFDRQIPDRNRAVLTTLGVDVSSIPAMQDKTLEFWFDLGSVERIIPIFDDQTETAYEETDGVDAGKTTVLPGSLSIPFNFINAGLQFQIKGPRMLRFMVTNKGDEAVLIRGIMGYYQYWLPYGATEFENADVLM